MHILRGGRALSPFRSKAIISRAQSLGLSVTSLESQFVYFILGEVKKLKVAAQLLDASEGRLDTDLIVIPRSGTVSPWSTKATEIFKNCGLSDVDRVERGIAFNIYPETNKEQQQSLFSVISDPMLEDVIHGIPEESFFEPETPKPLGFIALGQDPISALNTANRHYGLALSIDEIEYLANAYQSLGRNPTDAELMMFAQTNSEHCRHKIFNASWTVDNKHQPNTLFELIRNTHNLSPEGVLSAYEDNAAVIEGQIASRFLVDPKTHIYHVVKELVHIVMKVETHNHPTAVSPHPGAATGVGGEIRDEGATGRGAKPKAGLTGFSVNYLRIPNFPMPWEPDQPTPIRLASSLQIMLEGPVGGASFNNEFGRPSLNGYFRAFEAVEMTANGFYRRRGYTKPIMIAGGIGSISEGLVNKIPFGEGTPLIVLGGPAMMIGLGGGAASSSGGTFGTDFDYSSVQRANAEMERRCQEVIDCCCSEGIDNPILFIHDVGAGGLSNAFPELVKDGSIGADFSLNLIPSADPSLSPLGLWCNEAQERYVLAVSSSALAKFESICNRERCPFSIVGYAKNRPHLLVKQEKSNDHPVDLPMNILFGKPPKMQRTATRLGIKTCPVNLVSFEFATLAHWVLSHPTVASKNFLVTIGDRTVSGLVYQDQMVGPWQIPVADCAVTHSAIGSETGEVMAMGERTPLALLDAGASARISVAETITNMAGSMIGDLGRIKLSANWMCSAGTEGEEACLYDAVRALGESFCPALGICIPVGKDSMSMKTHWRDDLGSHEVTSPMSLICSGFAPVSAIEKTKTPLLIDDESVLIFIDLGKQRLGGSIVCEVTNQLGDSVPDVEAKQLKLMFDVLQDWLVDGTIMAYHDRSDGGLLTTVCEMLFASRKGITVQTPVNFDPKTFWFNEEIGCVVQIGLSKEKSIFQTCQNIGLKAYRLGVPNNSDRLIIWSAGDCILNQSRAELQTSWSSVSIAMSRLRDNPECVDQEASQITLASKGLAASIIPERISIIKTQRTIKCRPKVAILREQGVNGHLEMAYAFNYCGFEAIDVHMSDLITRQKSLEQFNVLAACGGFSYGDVLGAGTGWARAILFNDHLRQEFERFFHRADSITLGVCNGCQMLAQLAPIIPGASHFKSMKQNLSQQFEARFTLVELPKSQSVLLKDLYGTRFPIAVSHGEGRFQHGNYEVLKLRDKQLTTMHFVNDEGKLETSYPGNPNGSACGLAGLCSGDGRVTIMMPHPERVVLRSQLSFVPPGTGVITPWMTLFDNAWHFIMGRSVND